MRKHVFDRDLYDQCCGCPPRFTKSAGKWQACCMSCGRTVSETDPGALPIAWNKEVRGAK